MLIKCIFTGIMGAAIKLTKSINLKCLQLQKSSNAKEEEEKEQRERCNESV